MPWRFNVPPGWPAAPPGWVPPEGWTPDPAWPPAPPGWQFWVEEPERPSPGAPAAATPGAPGPPPRRRGVGRGLVVVTALLVVLGLAFALVATLSWATRRSQTRDLVTEAGTSAVRVDDACGSIVLRQGAAGVVTTRATIRYTWRMPVVTSRVEGDVVRVDVDCPTLSFGSSVALVVEVPPGGSVQARSSAGSVTAEGLSSDLELRSSAGSVTATDVTSSVVSAQSSAGSVSLSWASGADPMTISATSSAGGVRVTVPDVAGAAYRVDADSSAGSTTVEVRTDPASPRVITARSSAGSVVVGYR